MKDKLDWEIRALYREFVRKKEIDLWKLKLSRITTEADFNSESINFSITITINWFCLELKVKGDFRPTNYWDGRAWNNIGQYLVVVWDCWVCKALAIFIIVYNYFIFKGNSWLLCINWSPESNFYDYDEAEMLKCWNYPW